MRVTDWAATDERGIAYRLFDDQGATYWQARWDSLGWRMYVGTPQPEMWISFGLQGQVVLGSTVITGSTQPGTEAFATGTGGTWTRAAIALNQWRTSDPVMGVFEQPDGADATGRLSPEGYSMARSSPLMFTDSTGLDAINDSGALVTANVFGLQYDSNCTAQNQQLINEATATALMKIDSCTSGACGSPFNPSLKRRWLASVFWGNYSCPTESSFDAGIDTVRHFQQRADKSWLVNGTAALAISELRSNMNKIVRLSPAALDPGAHDSNCLAGTFAHEALHPALSSFDKAELEGQDSTTTSLSPVERGHATASDWVDFNARAYGSKAGAPSGTLIPDGFEFGHALITPTVSKCIGCGH